MFDRFSDHARSVMALARENALRLGHEHIAPEHVLLALTEEKNGKGEKVLQGLDVDLAALRAKVEAAMEAGTPGGDVKALPFTDGAKRVLENTVEEATRLDHHHLGSEHVLLGLLGEEQGAAARALRDVGVNLETVRARVRALSGR
jgi:ATP-dependent Clp protease ATP-binding subunit ClpC